MKRILLASLGISLCLMLGGCFSRQELMHTFDTYEVETNETIPYVCFDTLVLGSTKVDFGELLNGDKYSGVFHEVYVIQNDEVWFGFSDVERNEDGSRQWNIASMNIDDQEINIHYSGTFCLGNGADRFYEQNNNDHSKDGYQADNSFYYEGKIVITDHVKTVEYDLQTNISTEFIETSYTYPLLEIEADIVDHNTIVFSHGSNEKVFDVAHGKQTSKAFDKLFDLEDKTNLSGKPFLSELFDKVQIVNNQVYILCRVTNLYGETHAIVFQYDYINNSCKYAFHCFMNDHILNRLYIVPRY